MIFEVFLYLDGTIDINDDNDQEVEKDTEVCRDLFRLRIVFFSFFRTPGLLGHLNTFY